MGNERESQEPLPRRRRKTTTVAGSSSITLPKMIEPDVYQRVVEFEEMQASLRDPKEDALLFNNTCNEIRKAMSDIAVLKNKNTEQAKEEIAELRTTTSLLFITLKKLNRLEKIRTKRRRDIENTEKQQIDSCHLQLQNLLYEKLHLKKEVMKCLEFKSKDEEIDLVPVEEFFKEAPEHISRPEITKSDPHQLKVARLEWELLQRKQLADQCQQLEDAKVKVAAEILLKREQLENITPLLNNILEVTQPLQDYLGLPLDKVHKVHQMTHLLPRPLYLLYVQADAYREACDKLLTVIIGGDEKEAVLLQRSMATGVQDLENNDDSESDPELEAPEDLSDNQKRDQKMSKQDRLEERKKRLLLSHPLHVQLEIKLPDNNHVRVIFHYLMNLKVVAVKSLVVFPQEFHGNPTVELFLSQNILSELFPGDDGSESPNMANHYQLANVGLNNFKRFYTMLGIPYRWAQSLAGLDFMPSQPDIVTASQGADRNEEAASPEVNRPSVESVVQAIRHRLKARLELCRQVQAYGEQRE